jgi:polar amino acid transport system substrate-binding protein
VLSRRGVETSPFMFEDELIEALARREIAAAAVTATSAGYFNMTHPDKTVRLIRLDDAAPELGWNVAVGLLRPDDRLRDGIDAALERLLSDGTIERIYARYGVVLRPPQ